MPSERSRTKSSSSAFWTVDPALDLVVDDRFAFARRLQADDERLVALARRRRRATGCRSGTAAAPLRLLALRGELLLRHVAAIGRAALEQPVGDLGMARPELRLVIFVAVPIEAEPAHPVEDRVDRFLVERALSVSSIRSRNLPPWWRANSQLNKRRARAADVQESGRGGREAGDDGRLALSIFSLALKRAFLSIFMLQCNGRAPLT